MSKNICFAAALLLLPTIGFAQERGAVALGEAVAGLDVTARVLMIGAHPDDEDTPLIAWLARGRQVETGYLSLTRGDGGQNLIGNELGIQLGMIRTEELLAARRIDGGRQFFSRAFDFGFSKTAEETYRHWPKDSVLLDVITVIRAFRPQVIVGVFSGTPADGHGHHQVSALLAREAYDAAADTVRFPRSVTLGLGPWSPSKYYRTLRGNQNQATVTINVGALSPLRGRTYAELASISRSQHLSQGFGQLERRGTSLGNLKLEASRVGATDGKEQSPLDGIASDWSRFRNTQVSAVTRSSLDSLPAAIAEVRGAVNLSSPDRAVVPLARVSALIARVRRGLDCGVNRTYDIAQSCSGELGDLAVTLETEQRRVAAALLSAAGITLEATTPREQFAIGDTVPVSVTVYNQGRSSIALLSANAWSSGSVGDPVARTMDIAPDSAGQLTARFLAGEANVPWWLRNGQRGDVFILPRPPLNVAVGEDHLSDVHATVNLRIDGADLQIEASQVVYRLADPARGELRKPATIVPAISVLLDNDVEYARAGVPFERTYGVHLHSATSAVQSATVVFSAPGMRVDSATRHIALEPYSDATVEFHIRGTLSAGRHTFSANVTSGAQTYTSGFIPISYPHIRTLRYYRPARVDVEAVNATLPKNAAVAYIRGVGDNVAPMLAELGLDVTILSPADIATADFSKFGSVVVGPRAFAASKELAAQAVRLHEFARRGGTVVMQYGQREILAPGILPYPVTLQNTAERVTVEGVPVVVLDKSAGILTFPNRITQDDFTGWVQERSTYMPTTADPHYQRVLEMHDPGESPNENALLVAPVGKGAYVYVTLAMFRQLPAGVPGAARLVLNMIAADGKNTSTLPRP